LRRSRSGGNDDHDEREAKPFLHKYDLLNFSEFYAF
jgi:hypothetical protein